MVGSQTSGKNVYYGQFGKVKVRRFSQFEKIDLYFRQF